MKAHTPAFVFVALPIAALFATACGSGDLQTAADSTGIVAPSAGAEDVGGQAESAQHVAGTADSPVYRGPSVGAAKGFAALAASAITAINSSPVTGNLGVSDAPVSRITGFDAVPALKFGTDSSAPNSQRTSRTQREVDALVDDIDVRACDVDYADVYRDATGGVTLRPGVTCLNATDTDLFLHGRVTLDAGGDPNAFFIIRSNFTLTIADATVLVLSNGAQACSVFWQVQRQVQIGRGVRFYGSVIAGTGISMQSGSTLVGRALARTAAVELDANTITIPVYNVVGSPGTCTHQQ